MRQGGLLLYLGFNVFVSLRVSRVQAHAQNFQRMGGGVGREPYAHNMGNQRFGNYERLTSTECTLEQLCGINPKIDMETFNYNSSILIKS